MLEQSKLRISLEQVAQTTHEKILREREDTIKSEAEARHAEGMKAMQQQIESLNLQLHASQQHQQQQDIRIQELEYTLAHTTSQLTSAQGNLVQTTLQLTNTQDNLAQTTSLLTNAEGHLARVQALVKEALKKHSLAIEFKP